MNDDSEQMPQESLSHDDIQNPEIVKKERKSQFSEWVQQFEKEEGIERKIHSAIDFMRACLSRGGTPRFKEFWECRRLCLALFKEKSAAKMRAQLWAEYIELSNEARRLKDLLDEQSSFAVEQIELAIQPIERDLEHFTVLLPHLPDIAFPKECVSLKEKWDTYNGVQKELQLLGTVAMRINSLRKEIIKTEMRIRIKNALLERLSKCGDSVFPKRKELIKEISHQFTTDVEQFVQTYFHTNETHTLPLHVLREEIKHLQMLAKFLTLNTQAFTTTRVKLSECWDNVKSQERERKKEVLQKKQAYRHNYDLALSKINAFAEECQKEMSLSECAARASEISGYMKTLELGRDEVRSLKDELAKAKNIVQEREKEKETQRQLKERDGEAKRREKINALKEELNTLVHSIDSYDIDMLMLKHQELSEKFTEVMLNKIEKQIVDRLLKQLKDAIAEKKGKAVLALSEDDLKTLEQLKELLKERMQRRSEVKDQLEHYRKALGGSGFDFEKAMIYRELIESEKSSLEKIDAAIDELEQKMEEIEDA